MGVYVEDLETRRVSWESRRLSLDINLCLLAQRTEIPISRLTLICRFGFTPSEVERAVLAKALGLDEDGHELISVELMRLNQAHLKASRIMRMVRGNCALENSGLEQADYDSMLRKTEQELLEQPDKLWGVF